MSDGQPVEPPAGMTSATSTWLPPDAPSVARTVSELVDYLSLRIYLSTDVPVALTVPRGPERADDISSGAWPDAPSPSRPWVDR